MHAEERREFQRLLLSPPVKATLGTVAVEVLEIGILGARVQHAQRLDDEHADLRFDWNGAPVVLKCEVVRTIDRGGVLQSGVRFVAAVGDSGDSGFSCDPKAFGERTNQVAENPRHLIGCALEAAGDQTLFPPRLPTLRCQNCSCSTLPG